MEFTLSEYGNLISKTLHKFQCCNFQEAISLDLKKNCSRKIILRHDIDVSPSSALLIAKIEAELGAISNFTVMLSSDAYNPFEQKTRLILKEIAKLGHNIGLHFDASSENIRKEEELDLKISKHAKILEELLDVEINFFSYHNTNDFVLSCRESHYGGLINCYAKKIFDLFSYTSDSHGIWLYESWLKHLSKENNFLQVLTHPVWWTKTKIKSPIKISKHFRNRALNSWKDYCKATMYNSRNTPQRKMLPYYKTFGDDGLEILWLYFNGYEFQAENLFKSLCTSKKELEVDYKILDNLYNEISSLF